MSCIISFFQCHHMFGAEINDVVKYNDSNRNQSFHLDLFLNILQIIFTWIIRINVILSILVFDNDSMTYHISNEITSMIAQRKKSNFWNHKIILIWNQLTIHLSPSLFLVDINFESHFFKFLKQVIFIHSINRCNAMQFIECIHENWYKLET